MNILEIAQTKPKFVCVREALDAHSEVLQAIAGRVVESRVGEQRISDCLGLLARFPRFVVTDVQTQLRLTGLMCGTESMIIRTEVAESLCRAVSHECEFDARKTLNATLPMASSLLRLVWQQLVSRAQQSQEDFVFDLLLVKF